MADILSLKIDLKKVDKSKLFHADSGAIYLDVIALMKDEPDQYNNIGMLTQSVSKEDREAGIKGAILGNAKRIGTSNKQASKPAAKPSVQEDDSDLPF